MTNSPWWRDAVIYQVYPRSWADADGDGMGDLPGITSRLDHLAGLGVDAVWLSPFYPSPQHDAGYDVADYRDVDPRFGTLADFDALLARAHELGLRVMVDIVPNHSSSEHVWFAEALAAGPGSRERARYLFREGHDDGKGDPGGLPPNNWPSNFGGPAWTRVTEADGTPGQWYLHLFDTSQPDFDWTNPEVREEFDAVLRFWLDRGVDGFRIDVAHGLVKQPELPDAPPYEQTVDDTASQPMWDQPGVHEIYRRWRSVTDDYRVDGDDADRILCAEAWVIPDEALARYVRSDELHHTFNFIYLMTAWNAVDQQQSISRSLDAAASVGAPQTWVLSNHDVVRHASRLGFPPRPGQLSTVPGIGPGDPQPDPVAGLRRARAATTVMLALPGAAYLYQGEELGLPEAMQLADEVRQDPTFARTAGRQTGRDGCRVPMPWQADAPSYGFGPGDSPWLPQPAEYGRLAVDRQMGAEGSTLELYRALLAVRRRFGLGRGELSWREETGEDVLAFDIVTESDEQIAVLANLGAEPVELPAAVAVLAGSADLTADGRLPTDAAVWLQIG